MLPAATNPAYIHAVSAATPGDEAEAFLTRFVRQFGLHHPQYTEDGQPVSMSVACLLAELRADGPLRQCELGRRLSLERGNVSHAVAQLVRRGWLRRQLAATDRRGVMVGLTEQGARVADQLALARRDRLLALLERIPADRRAGVLAALAMVATAAGERPPGRRSSGPAGSIELTGVSR
jgi:DNA-binding MarR family transcriptional regulator